MICCKGCAVAIRKPTGFQAGHSSEQMLVTRAVSISLLECQLSGIGKRSWVEHSLASRSGLIP